MATAWIKLQNIFNIPEVVSLHDPNPNPWQLCSLWIYFFRILHVKQITQYTAFCVGFLSPSMMFIRFNYLVASIGTSFIYSWIIFPCVHISFLFLHSFIDGQCTCFHLLAIGHPSEILWKEEWVWKLKKMGRDIWRPGSNLFQGRNFPSWPVLFLIFQAIVQSPHNSYSDLSKRCFRSFHFPAEDALSRITFPSAHHAMATALLSLLFL